MLPRHKLFWKGENETKALLCLNRDKALTQSMHMRGYKIGSTRGLRYVTAMKYVIPRPRMNGRKRKEIFAHAVLMGLQVRRWVHCLRTGSA